MTPRDKHLKEMELVRYRISKAKGKVRYQLGTYYKRLRKDLHRYDQMKKV